jgi:hypothetical protein
MEITTIGELLHWSYANLAMAHKAVISKDEKYGPLLRLWVTEID